MYGISFRANKGIEFVLTTVATSISLCQCRWIVDCLWIEDPEEHDYRQIQKQMYSTDELIEVLTLKTGFVYFARIRRYMEGDSIEEIVTPSDFEASECSMIILCIDANAYEVYGKHREEIDSLYESLCNTIEMQKVSMEVDEKVGRTSFLI